jgi:predicted nucleic acid-binding protein
MTPVFLDANVVIRYLVGAPADQAERAARWIEGSGEVRLATLTLAEIGYVLTKVYRRERAQVVDALRELVLRENVRVPTASAERVVEALGFCRDSNAVDFADALLWAEAACADASVCTFDQNFPGSRGVAVVP